MFCVHISRIFRLLAVLVSIPPLFYTAASASTVVTLITSKGIVMGADGKAVDQQFHDAGATKKIALLKGRLIVANVGGDTFGVTGEKPMYEFVSWIGEIDKNSGPAVSVSELAQIVRDRGPWTLPGIRSRIEDGTINADNYKLRHLTMYDIAGYENGKPMLIEVSDEIDFANRTLFPVRLEQAPQDARAQNSLSFLGEYAAILNISKSGTYAYNEVRRRAELQMKLFNANKAMSLNQP